MFSATAILNSDSDVIQIAGNPAGGHHAAQCDLTAEEEYIQPHNAQPLIHFAFLERVREVMTNLVPRGGYS